MREPNEWRLSAAYQAPATSTLARSSKLGGSPLNTPFGAPFEELELAHLTTYFEELRAETLAWEAKGGQIRPEHVRDGVCGFANSVLGGYLVLGVSRADPKAKAGERCRYKVDGWEQEDPATWIGSCIGYGGIRYSTLTPSFLIAGRFAVT